MAHEMMDPRKLTLDAATQQRVGGEPPEKVEEYAGKMKAGEEFPPIEAYSDGEHTWVWDGHIRTRAAVEARQKEVRVNLRRGDLAKAVLASLGCNEAHGLPRTSADRRKAVLTALALPGNEKISAGDLAKLCQVSKPFAAEVKKGQLADQHQDRRRAAEAPAGNGDGQPEAAPSTETPKPDVVKVTRRKKDGGTTTYEMKTGGIGKGATGRPPKAGGVKAAVADQAAKEAAAREPDEPVRDETGADIPEKLNAVWEAGARFRACAKLIDDVKKELKAVAEEKAGSWLNASIIEDHLKAAKKLVMAAQPHAVCPICQGAGRGCNTTGADGKEYSPCRKSGFLNEDAYGQLPAEQRA